MPFQPVFDALSVMAEKRASDHLTDTTQKKRCVCVCVPTSAYEVTHTNTHMRSGFLRLQKRT